MANSVQDNDGKWSKFEYNNSAHTYHSRVAWPVFKLFSISGDEKYKVSAEKNIDWVLSNYKGNGWFNEMGFKWEEKKPFTHTIVYTLRGLFESSFYLGEEKKNKILDIVKTAAENLLQAYESDLTKKLINLKFYQEL